MTMMPLADTHVYLDEKGDAWIRRAGVSVKQLAETLRQLDFRAELVVRDYPYLTLSEVHAALSYYYDHRGAIDRAIEDDRQRVESAREAAPEAPATRRLREMGRVP